MSSSGYRRAELEKKRREQLRLQQLRDQARGLLGSCRDAIKAITEPAVQQLIAEDLRHIQQHLNQVSGQIESSPQQSGKAIKKLQQRLNRVVADAEATALKLSRQQAQARAILESARQSLKAEKEAANKGAEKVLAEAEEKSNQASSLYNQGRYEEMSSVCERIPALIEQAGQKTLDESVRREVVGGLLSTLTNMGFVVEQPRLEGDDSATGVVKLTGRMPSGKMAKFEINLDGGMQFDFDGYEGRACAKDLDQIDKTLQEQFAVKLSGSQITWKNPDKIAKGARNMPSGSRDKTSH